MCDNDCDGCEKEKKRGEKIKVKTSFGTRAVTVNRFLSAYAFFPEPQEMPNFSPLIKMHQQIQRKKRTNIFVRYEKNNCQVTKKQLSGTQKKTNFR
jgi:hypothetical protein